MAPKACKTDVGLQFHVLTGPEFEKARYGERAADWQLMAKPWLQEPRLKYFYDRSVFERGPDRRVFFLATREVEEKKNRSREAVAMLEIDHHEAGPSPTVGIKYVSVLEAFRNQGLALHLYGLLAEHLLTTGQRLYRTRPGAQTPEAFTAAVTRMLNSKGIDWYTRSLF